MKNLTVFYVVLAGIFAACGGVPDLENTDPAVTLSQSSVGNPSPPTDGAKTGHVVRSKQQATSAASPNIATSSYYWAQGDQAVVMFNQNDGWCFLTYVTGHFAGRGEAVWIYNSNGYWVLTGQSGQQGVAAIAQCVGWSTLDPSDTNVYILYDAYALAYGGHGTVTQGLWGTGAVCSLMGVGGAFDGSGESVRVGINSNWYLSASSGQVNGTEAWAGCFALSNGSDVYTNEFDWYQGQSTVYVNLSYGTFAACGLNWMTGKFAGSGEYVGCGWSGSELWITGGSQQFSVATGARGVLPSP